MNATVLFATLLLAGGVLGAKARGFTFRSSWSPLVSPGTEFFVGEMRRARISVGFPDAGAGTVLNVSVNGLTGKENMRPALTSSVPVPGLECYGLETVEIGPPAPEDGRVPPGNYGARGVSANEVCARHCDSFLESPNCSSEALWNATAERCNCSGGLAAFITGEASSPTIEILFASLDPIPTLEGAFGWRVRAEAPARILGSDPRGMEIEMYLPAQTDRNWARWELWTSEGKTLGSSPVNPADECPPPAPAPVPRGPTPAQKIRAGDLAMVTVAAALGVIACGATAALGIIAVKSTKNKTEGLRRRIGRCREASERWESNPAAHPKRTPSDYHVRNFTMDPRRGWVSYSAVDLLAEDGGPSRGTEAEAEGPTLSAD